MKTPLFVKRFRTLPKKARTVFIATIIIIILFLFFIIKSFMVTTERDVKEQEIGKANVNASKLLNGKETGGVSGNQSHNEDLKKRQSAAIEKAKGGDASYIPSVEDEEKIADITVTTAEDARNIAKEKAKADGLVPKSAPSVDIFGQTSSFETVNLSTKQDVPNTAGMKAASKQHAAKVNSNIKYLTSKIKSWGVPPAGLAVTQNITTDKIQFEGNKKNTPASNEGAVNPSANQNNNINLAKPSKRGYLKGDVIIASLDNYLNSDNAADYARLTIQQGPLRNAKVLAKPTVKNNAFNVSTYWITYDGYSIPFKAVAVTVDDKMQTALSTDVDYHTFQNTSLLILGSVVEGVAERASETGTTVTTSNTVISSKPEATTKDLWIAGLGKVGERGARAAINNSNRAPTVILDGKEKGIVGLMMIEDFNPQWLPEIKESKVY
jgi:hypothetical protein